MGLGQPSDPVVSRLRFPRAKRLEVKLRLLENRFSPERST